MLRFISKKLLTACLTGKSKDKKCPERGVSLLETAITLPVLLIIATSTIELSRYIRWHITASQMAYEGARLASSMPGLVIPGQNSVNQGVRQRIVDKVLTLAARQNISNVAVNVDYSPDETSNGTVNRASNSVFCEVDIPYTPIINLWGKDKIRSTASIAYLYPEA